MKLLDAATKCWRFVLDTEWGPEQTEVTITAPTQAIAERIISDEYGEHTCIVSINGKPANRKPTFTLEEAKEKVGALKTLPAPKNESKAEVDNIIVPEHCPMLPGAQEAVNWK